MAGNGRTTSCLPLSIRVPGSDDGGMAREHSLLDAGARLVTKGKSMVSEEIGLNEFLEANKIRAVETDLG